ncbi:misexpression suppressor of ras 3 [Brevipalpus obovatus]|uniref:misexpression suppressor of ras 3 n=1 Tax=Brevipalpus obovatus TaxID=246614 RepID=UPI003D9DEA35
MFSHLPSKIKFIFRPYGSQRPTSTQVHRGPGDYLKVGYFAKEDVLGIESLEKSQKERLREAMDGFAMPSNKLDRESETYQTAFGQVRLDSENKVYYMGQFDEDNDRLSIDRKRYLLFQNAAVLKRLEQERDQLKFDCQSSQTSSIPDPNPAPILQGEKIVEECTEDPRNFANWSPEDLQEFRRYYSVKSKQNKPLKGLKFAFAEEWKNFQFHTNERVTDDFYTEPPPDDPSILQMIQFAADSPLRSVDEVISELKQSFVSNSTANDSESIKKEKNEMEEAANEMARTELADEVPKTALDYIKKLREGSISPSNTKFTSSLESRNRKMGLNLNFKKYERARTDSLGFRTYKDATLNLFNLRRDEVLLELKRRIILDENDIVAIDKPYGMIVAGATGKNQDHICLESYLQELSKLVCSKDQELRLVHRLDKDTTGVLLLAKSSEMESTLRSLFKERKIKKYYWALVKSCIHPRSGIIDIPIELEKKNGKERMVLRPYCDEDFNRTMGITSKPLAAVTHYRVLREMGDATLVEVSPEQGCKHQVRVHLGFGLRAPILGDHKYSHLDKIAPQRLSQYFLAKLNMRQPKVRTIPMHLHAKLLVVPELGRNRGNIFIPAHLPGFFQNSLSLLGLNSREAHMKKPLAILKQNLKDNSCNQNDLPSTYLENEEVYQIERFYTAHKTFVYVSRCMANLYFTKTDLINEGRLSSPRSHEWQLERTGVPVIIFDKGETKARDKRKLQICLAERGTGFNLWNDIIDNLTDYKAVHPCFHTLYLSSDHRKVAGLSFDSVQAASDFLHQVEAITCDPVNIALSAPKRSNSKKEAKSKVKRHTVFKLPTKEAISSPCLFEHVTTVKIEDFDRLCSIASLVPRKVIASSANNSELRSLSSLNNTPCPPVASTSSSSMTSSENSSNFSI